MQEDSQRRESQPSPHHLRRLSYSATTLANGSLSDSSILSLQESKSRVKVWDRSGVIQQQLDKLWNNWRPKVRGKVNGSHLRYVLQAAAKEQKLRSLRLPAQSNWSLPSAEAASTELFDLELFQGICFSVADCSLESSSEAALVERLTNMKKTIDKAMDLAQVEVVWKVQKRSAATPVSRSTAGIPPLSPTFAKVFQALPKTVSDILEDKFAAGAPFCLLDKEDLAEWAEDNLSIGDGVDGLDFKSSGGDGGFVVDFEEMTLTTELEDEGLGLDSSSGSSPCSGLWNVVRQTSVTTEVRKKVKEWNDHVRAQAKERGEIAVGSVPQGQFPVWSVCIPTRPTSAHGTHKKGPGGKTKDAELEQEAKSGTRRALAWPHKWVPLSVVECHVLDRYYTAWVNRELEQQQQRTKHVASSSSAAARGSSNGLGPSSEVAAQGSLPIVVLGSPSDGDVANLTQSGTSAQAVGQEIDDDPNNSPTFGTRVESVGNLLSTGPSFSAWSEKPQPQSTKPSGKSGARDPTLRTPLDGWDQSDSLNATGSITFSHTPLTPKGDSVRIGGLDEDDANSALNCTLAGAGESTEMDSQRLADTMTFPEFGEQLGTPPRSPISQKGGRSSSALGAAGGGSTSEGRRHVSSAHTPAQIVSTPIEAEHNAMQGQESVDPRYPNFTVVLGGVRHRICPTQDKVGMELRNEESSAAVPVRRVFQSHGARELVVQFSTGISPSPGGSEGAAHSHHGNHHGGFRSPPVRKLTEATVWRFRNTPLIRTLLARNWEFPSFPFVYDLVLASLLTDRVSIPNPLTWDGEPTSSMMMHSSKGVSSTHHQGAPRAAVALSLQDSLPGMKLLESLLFEWMVSPASIRIDGYRPRDGVEVLIQAQPEEDEGEAGRSQHLGKGKGGKGGQEKQKSKPQHVWCLLSHLNHYLFHHDYHSLFLNGKWCPVNREAFAVMVDGTWAWLGHTAKRDEFIRVLCANGDPAVIRRDLLLTSAFPKNFLTPGIVLEVDMEAEKLRKAFDLLEVVVAAPSASSPASRLQRRGNDTHSDFHSVGGPVKARPGSSPANLELYGKMSAAEKELQCMRFTHVYHFFGVAITGVLDSLKTMERRIVSQSHSDHHNSSHPLPHKDEADPIHALLSSSGKLDGSTRDEDEEEVDGEGKGEGEGEGVDADERVYNMEKESRPIVLREDGAAHPPEGEPTNSLNDAGTNLHLDGGAPDAETSNCDLSRDDVKDADGDGAFITDLTANESSQKKEQLTQGVISKVEIPDEEGAKELNVSGELVPWSPANELAPPESDEPAATLVPPPKPQMRWYSATKSLHDALFHLTAQPFVGSATACNQPDRQRRSGTPKTEEAQKKLVVATRDPTRTSAAYVTNFKQSDYRPLRLKPTPKFAHPVLVSVDAAAQLLSASRAGDPRTNQSLTQPLPSSPASPHEVRPSTPSLTTILSSKARAGSSASGGAGGLTPGSERRPTIHHQRTSRPR